MSSFRLAYMRLRRPEVEEQAAASAARRVQVARILVFVMAPPSSSFVAAPAMSVVAEHDDERSALVGDVEPEDAEPRSLRSGKPLLHLRPQDGLLAEIAPAASGDDLESIHPPHPARVDPLGDPAEGVVRTQTMEVDFFQIVIRRAVLGFLPPAGARHHPILLVPEPTPGLEGGKLSLVMGVPKRPPAPPAITCRPAGRIQGDS